MRSESGGLCRAIESADGRVAEEKSSVDTHDRQRHATRSQGVGSVGLSPPSHTAAHTLAVPVTNAPARITLAISPDRHYVRSGYSPLSDRERVVTARGRVGKLDN